MIKRILQKLIPSFILNKYKEEQYFKILRDFNIKDQPDLLVAEKLVSLDSLFVDIGANVGLYTKHLSPLVKEVQSFEPVPFTFSMLSKNVARFGLKNVILNPFAISSKEGFAIIDVPIQAGARNYYRASLEASGEENISDMKFEIPTKTLDSLFFDKAPEIALIKCDIEGHELACIQGAKRFLEKSSAAWLIEISEDPDNSGTSAHQVFEIMEAFNFDVFLFEKNILRSRKTGDSSVNYFFLKKHHLEQLKSTSLIIEA